MDRECEEFCLCCCCSCCCCSCLPYSCPSSFSLRSSGNFVGLSPCASPTRIPTSPLRLLSSLPPPPPLLPTPLLLTPPPALPLTSLILPPTLDTLIPEATTTPPSLEHVISPTPTFLSHHPSIALTPATVFGHRYTLNTVPSNTHSARRHLRSRACTPGCVNSILRGMIAMRWISFV